MKKLLAVTGLCLLYGLFLLPFNSAQAEPLLQLDIVGGTWDPVNESVITGDDDFQLVALLNDKNGHMAKKGVSLSTTFYIVASWDTSSGQSFSFDGTSVDLDDTMYSPPCAQLNHGELGTYGGEFAFMFGGARTKLYNVQDNPGAFAGNTGGDAFYQVFDVINLSDDPFTPIHFDLYGYDSRGKMVKAPFSHDASHVPEPATMLLFGAGLTGFIVFRRKFRNE